MAWYDTGTVAVTNGSTIVTGTGTNFIVGAQVGEAFYGPDSKLYEIQTITSATVMVLADAYLGSTQSGQAYQIVPTQSLVADLAVSVTDLISDFADVRDYAGNGKFNDGAVGTPGITFTQDQDNGLYRIGANNWALAAGGQKIVDVSTSGIALPDNGKATFGASDDLEIYHDGSNSYVNDQGTGDLILRASSSVKLQSASGVLEFLSTNSGTGALTLAPTNFTGSIDVTGTATMDGLVVDGNATISNATNPKLEITDTTVPNTLRLQALNGDSLIGTTTATSLLIKTSNTTRASFSPAGNFSLYEDTGTTPKLFWDASAESLGIGTSSPTDLLNISGSSNQIGLDTGDQATYGTLDIGHFINGAFIGTQAGSNAASNILRLGTSGSERMRIDSAGNVGIGTSAPESGLHLVNDGLSNQLRLSNTTADSTTKYGSVLGSHYSNLEEPIVGMLLTSSSSATGGAVSIGGGISSANAVNTIKFYTAANNTTLTGTERMRIDSAGNASFNTTDISPAYNNVFGTAILQYGGASMSRNNSTTLDLNRSTSDGAIINLRKDGTTVGSIGTVGGDIVIGTGACGIRFHNGTPAIQPRNSNGTANNDAIDIGLEANRFKDLYLSGGVYLGGTGAANKLDDYEEGTFTATVSGSTTAGSATYPTQAGTYEKIGDMVHFRLYIQWSSGTGTGSLHVGGLPFSSTGTNTPYESVAIGYVRDLNFSGVLTAYTEINASYIVLRENFSNATGNNLTYDADGRLMLSGSYRAV